ELKGKDAVFAVTLHGIKVREVPELNDQFVKDTTQFENVAEYRADVQKRLCENAARREENENKNNVIEAIVANATVDIPACMVENELDYMLQDFEYRLAYMYGGMKMDDYFKYTGSSREDFKKDRRAEAEKAVKTRLTVEAVIKAEKIEPTEEELAARIEEIAKTSGKTGEEYRKTLSDAQINHIKSDVTVEKTLNMLVKETTFDKSAEKKEPKTSTAKAATKTTATKKTGGTATAKKSTAKASDENK
ncbi:MAG: hypothetical protein K2L51_02270, partial [Clostridiales bacterium]|nr:hypothetical protein [Clostridiales bacterium]